MEMAERIESRGRLKIDLLINNTNLAEETTPEMIEEGEKTVLTCAERMRISRVLTCGKHDLLARCRLSTEPIGLVRHMVPEWMEET